MTTRLQHSFFFLAERGCIIVSIQAAPTDDELTALLRGAAQMLARNRPRYVVLDLTGLDVADSFSVQSLQRLCAVIHLYSVNMLIAGIQPEVAFSMAMRGLSLEGVSIVADLTDAFELLDHPTPAHGARKETGWRHRQSHREKRQPR